MSSVFAAKHHGPCPKEFSSNTPVSEFNKKAMTGLWFEYVWENGFQEGLDYQCAMWTILEDKDDAFVAFNHLQPKEGEGKFA